MDSVKLAKELLRVARDLNKNASREFMYTVSDDLGADDLTVTVSIESDPSRPEIFRELQHRAQFIHRVMKDAVSNMIENSNYHIVDDYFNAEKQSMTADVVVVIGERKDILDLRSIRDRLVSALRKLYK